MQKEEPVYLKRAAILISALCIYMLHTILVLITEPGTALSALLVLIYLVIYQGLEYQVTIPSEGEEPITRRGDVVSFGAVFPLGVYLIAWIAAPKRLSEPLLATTGCIACLVVYIIIKTIFLYISEE